jgi:alcohol dehydrogenase class IV
LSGDLIIAADFAPRYAPPAEIASDAYPGEVRGKVVVRVFETLRTERVVEGSGAFGELISEVERQGFERVLLVSGRSVSKTREFSIAVNRLGSNLAGVETSVRAHNPVNSILRLADLVREIQADCIVSVGGGSAVDAAKLASLCASLGL